MAQALQNGCIETLVLLSGQNVSSEGRFFSFSPIVAKKHAVLTKA
jgi:hypothetical protein